MTIREISFLESENVKRNVPRLLKEEDKQLFEKELFRTFSEVKLYVLSHAFFLGSGFVAKGIRIFFGFFYPYGIISWKDFFLRMGVAILSLFGKRKENYENGLYIIDCFSGSFFHWFGDVLQRMEALNKTEGILLKNYVVFLPDKPYFRRLAPLLEVYTPQVVFVKIFEKIFCKHLLIVPPVAPTGNYRPVLMKNMRERMLMFIDSQSVGNEKRNQNKRIYISRKKAPRRRLVNEEDIFPILQKYGFEILIMEDLSLKEQIAAVQGAEVLMGLHGAGLTHMLWMKEKARVVELRGEKDDSNNCFFALAEALALSYFYFLVKPIQKGPTQEVDFFIDAQAFELFMKRMFD
ncbi:MAG: glycosyltransferase family 61 protein [Brevinematales bacterium]|nr:glycosyltransferase family 61 protein [Brevinematales bacterium]